MKALALLIALVALQEPAPFPPGQFCIHAQAGQPAPQHPCTCQRTCDEHGAVREDPQCKQWCHKDSCHCAIPECP